ncbi:hypothetical protein EVAR_52906_1 [Eumeta japonica]|uniref:Uncharacterized protein n=1 Tax=Eumeta variegata TaxID=151549 RepID=A0A4C1Y5J8_EUMVA|nr:hypothetical protein EVAR_52906_1 [Eumeta japonica]
MKHSWERARCGDGVRRLAAAAANLAIYSQRRMLLMFTTCPNSAGARPTYPTLTTVTCDARAGGRLSEYLVTGLNQTRPQQFKLEPSYETASYHIEKLLEGFPALCSCA